MKVPIWPLILEPPSSVACFSSYSSGIGKEAEKQKKTKNNGEDRGLCITKKSQSEQQNKGTFQKMVL